MNYKTEKVDNILIIEILTEKFDVNQSIQFVNEVEPLLDKVKNAVFDIRSLKFIDGPGCSFFQLCQTSLRSAGGIIKLCNVSEQVATIFRLIRMDHIIDIFTTRKEALDSF